MRNFYMAGMAAFLTFGATGGHAADIEDEGTKVEGAYIVARMAAAFNSDSQFSMEFTKFKTNVLTQYNDKSFAGAVAVGYRFDGMFSLELEGGQTSAKVKAHTLLAVPTATSTVPSRFDGANATGTATVTYGMANIVTEQDTGTFARPYISAGFGLGQANINKFNINLPAPIAPLDAGDATLVNDTRMTYVWQIGAGAVIDITKNLALEAGYRYFRVEDIDLRTSTSNETSLNLNQHQGLLGVRVHF